MIKCGGLRAGGKRADATGQRLTTRTRQSIIARLPLRCGKRSDALEFCSGRGCSQADWIGTSHPGGRHPRW
jgi:hypothetical protein